MLKSSRPKSLKLENSPIITPPTHSLTSHKIALSLATSLAITTILSTPSHAAVCTGSDSKYSILNYTFNGCNANQESLTIDDATQGSFIGMRKEGAPVSGVNVVVNALSSGEDVVGALSEHNSATNNTVTINSGVTVFDAIGGVSYWTDSNKATSDSANHEASHNTVIMNNATAARLTGGLAGGRGDNSSKISINANANHNKVIMRGGTINGEDKVASPVDLGQVTGGVARYAGDANFNEVEISKNANIDGYVMGGRANNGSTNENIVKISDSTITGSVYGGFTDKANAKKIASSSLAVK